HSRGARAQYASRQESPATHNGIRRSHGRTLLRLEPGKPGLQLPMLGYSALRAPSPRVSRELPAQLRCNPLESPVPVASRLLLEQSDGRIPRAILPVDEPTPVAIEREQHPGLVAQCPVQMDDAGVH